MEIDSDPNLRSCFSLSLRVLLGIVGILPCWSGSLPGQTNAPAFQFLSLAAAAQTNYNAGEIAKARERLNQFLQLNELDALHRTLVLQKETADFCVEQGDAEFALEILQRGLRLVEKTAGPDDPEAIFALANIGALHLKERDALRALPIFRRCLAIVEQRFGGRSTEAAAALEWVAACHAELQEYPEAIESRVRSLRIRGELGEADLPSVLQARGELAALYQLESDFAAALPLLERNIDAAEGLLGADVLKLLALEAENRQEANLDARSKTNAVLLSRSLDQLCRAQFIVGRYDEALASAGRLKRLSERLFGHDSPAVAEALITQAWVQSGRTRQQKDEVILPTLIEADRILELNFGKDDARLLTVLNNLGLATQNAGRSIEALDYFRRSLALVEKAYGPDSLASVSILENIAVLQRDRGEYDLALPLHKRSVRLSERYFGKGNPATVLAACHLAIWYIKQGLFPRFIFEENGASSAWRKYLPTQLSLLSDRDAEGLAANLRFFVDGMHSMGDVKYAGGAEDFPRFAAEGLAMGKALLEEASIARVTLDALPADRARALRDEYKNLNNRLLALSGERLAPETLKNRREELVGGLRGVDQDLAAFSQIVQQSVQERDLTLADLAQSLPTSTVLVDFAKYRRWDYSVARNNWKEERYAVYLTFPLSEGSTNATALRVDLGEAASIDQLIDLICRRMGSGQFAAADVSAALRDLSNLVYRPIAGALTNAAHLIVCPDGELSRVPLEMLLLPSEETKHLVEQKVISYVGSGREVFRLTRPSPGLKSSSPLVIGNPDFNLDLGRAARAKVQVISLDRADAPPAEEAGENGFHEPPQTRGVRELSHDYTASTFSPLPATAEEARSVVKLLGPDCTLLLGETAREYQLKAVVSPRVLHIATHGFFLADPALPPQDPFRQDAQRMQGFSTPVVHHRDVWENPMIRCGIALAGANHGRESTSDNGEDGLLTGLEASFLNLRGTELVILSACHTGSGDVRIGEGVMSLGRAFRIAGAQTVLASHWPVSDKAAEELMITFISRWRSGQPRAKAWHQAQLSMLHSKEFANPYFWAAFTLTGQWN